MTAGPCSDPTQEIINRKQSYELGMSPPSNFSDGAVYFLICQSGYAWADGNQQMSINCTLEQWGQFPSPCTCMDFAK